WRCRISLFLVQLEEGQHPSITTFWRIHKLRRQPRKKYTFSIRSFIVVLPGIERGFHHSYNGTWQKLDRVNALSLVRPPPTTSFILMLQPERHSLFPKPNSSSCSGIRLIGHIPITITRSREGVNPSHSRTLLPRKRHEHVMRDKGWLLIPTTIATITSITLTLLAEFTWISYSSG